MLHIGLTGGIGSGKTTVANYFSDLGIDIFDADIIAQQIVTPNSIYLQQIINHFGTSIVDTIGNLKRDKLRAIIFANPSERHWLEQLLHPVILQEMYQQANAAKAPYCILVMPLLVEKNIEIDRVLVVDCSTELQIKRTRERSQLTETQINAILATQLSREQRLARADDIVVNNGSLAELQQQVLMLHQKYLQLAALG